jgi:hypothetical protein
MYQGNSTIRLKTPDLIEKLLLALFALNDPKPLYSSPVPQSFPIKLVSEKKDKNDY